MSESPRPAPSPPPSRAHADPARSARATADRARAWLVTGPLGRGLAFAIDFSAALRTAAHRRRSPQ